MIPSTGNAQIVSAAQRSDIGLCVFSKQISNIRALKLGNETQSDAKTHHDISPSGLKKTARYTITRLTTPVFRSPHALLSSPARRHVRAQIRQRFLGRRNHHGGGRVVGRSSRAAAAAKVGADWRGQRCDGRRIGRARHQTRDDGIGRQQTASGGSGSGTSGR